MPHRHMDWSNRVDGMLFTFILSLNQIYSFLLWELITPIFIKLGLVYNACGAAARQASDTQPILQHSVQSVKNVLIHDGVSLSTTAHIPLLGSE
jgi:hypothetical protein